MLEPHLSAALPDHRLNQSQPESGSPGLEAELLKWAQQPGPVTVSQECP